MTEVRQSTEVQGETCNIWFLWSESIHAVRLTITTE